MVDLAEIFRRHWPDYQAKFGAKILPSHQRLAQAILSCRTPALGGQHYRCEDCGQEHFAYHSCNHRACPKCGHHEATAWIANQKASLLPVPYYLITFTVPAQLRPLIRHQQKLWYELLFAHSSATLQEVAMRPKYLGATLGLLGILQTWTRDLRFHPHLHYLVPAGGITEDALRWLRPKNAGYFLPQPVLAARFRNRLRVALRRQHPQLLVLIPAQVWRIPWVVDVQEVGRGETALRYLSAYIYKTAITAQRLVACDDQGVSFTYRDRNTGTWKPVWLTAQRFLHRFLQHVLPKGFQRVRYYGWRSPAAKKRWQTILALLDWKPPLPLRPEPVPAPICPKCHIPMLLITRLPRAPPAIS